MAKRKVDITSEPISPSIRAKPQGDFKRKKNADVIVPPCEGREDAHRYVGVVRYGKQSFERFCKNPERRKELGLPPLPSLDV